MGAGVWLMPDPRIFILKSNLIHYRTPVPNLEDYFFDRDKIISRDIAWRLYLLSRAIFSIDCYGVALIILR